MCINVFAYGAMFLYGAFPEEPKTAEEKAEQVEIQRGIEERAKSRAKFLQSLNEDD